MCVCMPMNAVGESSSSKHKDRLALCVEKRQQKDPSGISSRGGAFVLLYTIIVVLCHFAVIGDFSGISSANLSIHDTLLQREAMLSLIIWESPTPATK